MPIFPATNPYFFNIWDYGARPGQDSSIAITNALADAAVAGGIVFSPPGTFITSPQTLRDNVGILGCGANVSIWQLKNGSNADLLSANAGNINLAGVDGTGSATAVKSFFIRDITLDGNKANQSGTSYTLRYYGYYDVLENVEIKNGLSGGVLKDYYGPTIYGAAPKRESVWDNVSVHDNGGIGAELGGPTDMQWTNGDVNTNTSHNIHLCKNATGFLGQNIHTWCSGISYGRVSYLIECAASFVNCEAEGSDVMQVVILASTVSWKGGTVFGPSHFGSGIQIGQKATGILKTAATTSPITLTNAPNTVAPSVILQFVITGAGASGSLALVGFDIAGGALSETVTCSGNGTFVSVNAYSSLTSATVTGLTGYSITINGLGVPYAGSQFQSGGLNTAVQCNVLFIDTLVHDINTAAYSIVFYNDGSGIYLIEAFQAAGSSTVLGTPNTRSRFDINAPGLTADGSLGKGGGAQIAANANNAFAITNGTTQYVNVNTFSASTKRMELANAMALFLYSDNFVTATLRLISGTICHYESPTSPATATAGTISTSGFGITRVTPTGNITGVILQVGFFSGQQVTVRNQSAFTITFAASGTSNVADGVLDVIAALTSRTYMWSTNDSLWSRIG
jgi:hypothetical protein